MQELHSQLLCAFVQRIRLASGRNSIDRDEFIRLLSVFAERNNITKITKITVAEIDKAMQTARLPRETVIASKLLHLHM